MENFPFDPTKHNEDGIIAYFQGMDTIEMAIPNWDEL